MLKLTRRIGESIQLTIDDGANPAQLAALLREGITITVSDIGKHRAWARISIQAPHEVRVMRAELIGRGLFKLLTNPPCRVE